MTMAKYVEEPDSN